MAKHRELNPEANREKYRRYGARYVGDPVVLKQKRDRRLLRVYGITRSEFDARLAEQGGGCAICGGGPNGIGDFHVDHCHKSKCIRGILCHKCNTMLGLANDDPARLLSAVEYLNRKT